jgi:hypothetical protein
MDVEQDGAGISRRWGGFLSILIGSLSEILEWSFSRSWLWDSASFHRPTSIEDYKKGDLTGWLGSPSDSESASCRARGGRGSSSPYVLSLEDPFENNIGFLLFIFISSRNDLGQIWGRASMTVTSLVLIGSVVGSGGCPCQQKGPRDFRSASLVALISSVRYKAIFERSLSRLRFVAFTVRSNVIFKTHACVIQWLLFGRRPE